MLVGGGAGGAARAAVCSGRGASETKGGEDGFEIMENSVSEAALAKMRSMSYEDYCRMAPNLIPVNNISFYPIFFILSCPRLSPSLP